MPDDVGHRQLSAALVIIGRPSGVEAPHVLDVLPDPPGRIRADRPWHARNLELCTVSVEQIVGVLVIDFDEDKEVEYDRRPQGAYPVVHTGKPVAHTVGSALTGRNPCRPDPFPINTEECVTVSDVNDWNTQIIEEFRANDGRVGGQFEGAPLLLLHTTGARSGQERVNPVMYQDLGGPVAVFASKAGAPTNPDWYHNLVANPDVTAEIGTETSRFRARIATSDERDRIWTQQKQDYPGFSDYEANTDRQIPVVILDPAA